MKRASGSLALLLFIFVHMNLAPLSSFFFPGPLVAVFLLLSTLDLFFVILLFLFGHRASMGIGIRRSISILEFVLINIGVNQKPKSCIIRTAGLK